MLGVLAGLILTPVVAVGLMYGVGEFYFAGRRLLPSWTGLAVLVPTGLLIGVMVGSRLSPLASLIGGLLFTALGVAWIVALPGTPTGSPGNLGADLLPDRMAAGYLVLLAEGGFLLLGVILLVASLFPARWRTARPAAPVGPYPADPHQGPGGPPPPAGPFPRDTPHGHATPPPLPSRQPHPQPDAPYRPQQYGRPGPTEITRPLPDDDRR